MQVAPPDHTLTYEMLMLASKKLQHPYYEEIYNQAKAITSPVERLFRLQKFIDLPTTPPHMKRTAVVIIEDLQNA